MRVTLTEAEQAEVQRRCAEERRTPRWRRYQALLLPADGWQAQAVAQALHCCPNSVSNWTRRWRQAGVAGLEERPHPGRRRLLDETAGQEMDRLVASDPRRTATRAPAGPSPC